jgi:methyltransferase
VYLISIAAVVYASMIVEAVRARRNERAQLARGGREPDGDVYTLMRVAYPAVFFVMIIEGALRDVPSAPVMAVGAVLFIAAKALKWWAIQSLGQAWTFRIIVMPGTPLVAEGPYRYLRHPNYVAVIGELVSVALLTNARVAGPVATIFFGALIVRRVSVENRALDAILRR